MVDGTLIERARIEVEMAGFEFDVGTPESVTIGEDTYSLDPGAVLMQARNPVTRRAALIQLRPEDDEAAAVRKAQSLVMNVGGVGG